ncbi:TMM25 protein, partial [Nothoprocta pentlandii]|nr:TMM25 protein [Nothoprocta pentlandii]
PEILRTDTHPAEAAAPGLLVVLLALVQANPPAAITWLGLDGRPVANTSLLVPDASGHPALANHTVRLSALPGTFSVHTATGLGVANASIPAPGRSVGMGMGSVAAAVAAEGPGTRAGLWDARVELPLLGVAAGVAVVLGALLGLGCVAARRHAKPGTGKGRRTGRCSQHSCPSCSQLPREHRSLPPNLRLSDLAQEPRGESRQRCGVPRCSESALLCGCSTDCSTCPLGPAGFVRLPATGYIYKVSSTSSDEIWL